MKMLCKALLPICAVLCTLLLLLVHEFTKERVAGNIRESKLQLVSAVMKINFDDHSFAGIKNIEHVSSSIPAFSTSVYRAKKEDRYVGVAFLPVVAKGYNGDIELSVGIGIDGELLGVHVLKHEETQGFGDSIHQDKSDWLKQFTGESLATIPIKYWAIKSDGGQFDQLSGATITARGAINAISDSLQVYMAEHEAVFSE